MNRKCRNCGTWSNGRWCVDCFRAFVIGALNAGGGLTFSGAVGYLLWWLS